MERMRTGHLGTRLQDEEVQVEGCKMCIKSISELAARRPLLAKTPSWRDTVTHRKGRTGQLGTWCKSVKCVRSISHMAAGQPLIAVELNS